MQTNNAIKREETFSWVYGEECNAFIQEPTRRPEAMVYTPYLRGPAGNIYNAADVDSSDSNVDFEVAREFWCKF